MSTVQTFSTDRQRFRATVAAVAAKARAILPTEVNGRIESAVKLVLSHDVTPQADGSIEAGSSSDPLKTYRLVGLTCDCQDFQRGQAPEGWCQHRVAAAIAKRVHQLLPPVIEVEATPVPLLPASPVAPPGSGPGQALPEAACSVNVRLLIDGRDCQVTVRGHDDGAVLARLETVLQRYPLPVQAPEPTHTRTEGWCSVHSVQMRWNPGKDGKPGWWSHKADGQWCKGRVKGGAR